MQQIFVEMYNYKQDWIDLGVPERRTFVATLTSALGELQAAGVEVLGYAVNDPATDHRAPYDFFCVYRVPEVGLQRSFEAGIAASGWYEYFDQVTLGGAARTPAGTLMKNVLLQPALTQGKPIIPPKRSAKKSTVVDGHQMTYVERGEGTPVVFIHGDVMSSFLWDNVMPYVADHHRAIAVDLIGAGDSNKLPASGEGTYSFETHAHYLEGLLENLDLGDDVVLVGHDWGSNLAFDWAMKHEDRVRAIAFTEALLPPFDWSDWPILVRGVFEHMRTPEGGKDVLDNNLFLNSSRDNIVRMLAPEEWAEIVRPYANPGESRRPTLDWPRSVPFGDDDTPIRKMLEGQSGWLTKTPIAKLHMAGVPGGIEVVGGRRRDTIAAFPNLSVIDVEGIHWMPLDDPHTMGEGLATWLASVTQN
jgi:haloalkane dehalogenase